MAQMTGLERTIFKAALDAQNAYERMTDEEHWLDEAPESFLQHEVAVAIFRKGGYSVYPEGSPRKLSKELDERSKGRSSVGHNQRFDIVVWRKSSALLKALIEIKTRFEINLILKDAKKLAGYAPINGAVGYLLFFTAPDGRNHRRVAGARLTQILKNLKATGNRWSLVKSKVAHPAGEQASWALGLFRLN